MFSILVYSIELNLFKFLPCAIHSSFVKEKQQMLKTSNIPFPYYAILFLLSTFNNLSVINSKKYLVIGNCSAEIFGCSIEALIPWEIMTSSEMIF